MTNPSPFGAFVPGFEFLQGLVKNAGTALPSVGQWVAPSLDPEELDKRINELKTVQFWLEQNVRMLSTTIQAMEVQRMTLSTLKTMNVSMADLRESMTIKMPDLGAATKAAEPAATEAAADAAANTAAGVVDPMKWWGALTQQFTDIASNALKDGSAEAARETMGAMMKQSFDAAGQTLKQAAAMPVAVVQQAAEVASAAANVAAQAAAKVPRKRATKADADASAEAADAADAAESASKTRRAAPRKTGG